MTTDRKLALLQECNAILKGHFLLASGLHSDTYFQCAKIFEHPKTAQELCADLAKMWKDVKIDVVAGPALGGVIVGYELAKQLGVRAIYLERVDNVFQLRRGFQIRPGERVLVAEDVVTTGGSAKEAADVLRSLGAKVVGLSAVVFRGKKFDGDLRYLIAVDAPTWKPEACPLPGDPIKPGAPKK